MGLVSSCTGSMDRESCGSSCTRREKNSGYPQNLSFLPRDRSHQETQFTFEREPLPNNFEPVTLVNF